VEETARDGNGERLEEGEGRGGTAGRVAAAGRGADAKAGWQATNKRTKIIVRVRYIEPLRMFIWILIIVIPVRRVCKNVTCNALIIRLTAENMLIIITLPDIG